MLLVRALLGSVFPAAELWTKPEAALQERARHLGADPALVSRFPRE
jgi:hypothetical protein